MSRRDVRVPLMHMLDHAREAVQMTARRSRRDLDSDRQFALAVTRLMEIVGEAASRIPEDVQQKIPGIPWAGVVGLRNRLIHGYDEVDFDILWDVLELDLPQLIGALEEYVDGLG